MTLKEIIYMAVPKGVITFQGAGLSFVGLETGQSSVTTGATEIVTAEASRGRLLLANTSTNVTVFVGQSTSVTTSNGYPLLPLTQTPLEYTGDLYGIVQTTTTIVGWLKLR